MADAGQRFTGLWVAIESRIADDRRVMRLAKALGISIPLAVGHLVLLWGAVAEHEPTGDLTNVTDEELETWADWVRKRTKRFAPAYRKLFVDANGRIHAWDDHNGKFLAKALRERERSRLRRLGDRGQTTEEPQSERGRSALNPTRPNPTQPTTPGEAGNNAVSAADTSDIAAIVQIAEALNTGMRDNPGIVNFRPVRPAAIVGDWLAEGIPLSLIAETVTRLGREFKPTGKDRQISSLRYCDTAVRGSLTAAGDARYHELKGKAQRGLDMAKYPDWPQYDARFRREGKAKVTSGAV